MFLHGSVYENMCGLIGQTTQTAIALEMKNSFLLAIAAIFTLTNIGVADVVVNEEQQIKHELRKRLNHLEKQLSKYTNTLESLTQDSQTVKDKIKEIKSAKTKDAEGYYTNVVTTSYVNGKETTKTERKKFSPKPIQHVKNDTLVSIFQDPVVNKIYAKYNDGESLDDLAEEFKREWKDYQQDNNATRRAIAKINADYSETLKKQERESSNKKQEIQKEIEKDSELRAQLYRKLYGDPNRPRSIAGKIGVYKPGTKIYQMAADEYEAVCERIKKNELRLESMEYADASSSLSSGALNEKTSKIDSIHDVEIEKTNFKLIYEKYETILQERIRTGILSKKDALQFEVSKIEENIGRIHALLMDFDYSDADLARAVLEDTKDKNIEAYYGKEIYEKYRKNKLESQNREELDRLENEAREREKEEWETEKQRRKEMLELSREEDIKREEARTRMRRKRIRLDNLD